jgi:L-iditol 2-dehydrogenase
MKAMQLTGIRKMELFDVPDPKIISDNDVLIKMTHVGVCGSDVHYYTTGRIGSQIVQYPFTVGHEGAGVIEKVGNKVTRVKPGDRVAIDPAMPCFECDQCKSGRLHTCRKLKFLGCPGQAEGCLSEYLVMPENSCFILPENLSLEDGALSEPLTIGVYAVNLSQLKPGMDIGILGCGPIGLSVLAASQVIGPRKIVATDKLDYRIQIAKNSGATFILNPDKQDVLKEVIQFEPALLDIVFECSGTQEAVDQALEILKPGGKLMQIGIPEFDRFSFSADLMRRKEICIQNVRRQNESVTKCISQMTSGKLNAQSWVTHHFKLSECKQAFDLVANYKDGVVKAVIEIG